METKHTNPGHNNHAYQISQKAKKRLLIILEDIINLPSSQKIYMQKPVWKRNSLSFFKNPKINELINLFEKEDLLKNPVLKNFPPGKKLLEEGTVQTKKLTYDELILCIAFIIRQEKRINGFLKENIHNGNIKAIYEDLKKHHPKKDNPNQDFPL